MAESVGVQTLTQLCAVAEVSEGEVTRVKVEGREPLAVYCVGDRYYASEEKCTHGNGFLTRGIVDGDLIECPVHGGTFDIATGTPMHPPCTIPLQVYRVEIKDGQVFAALDKNL